MSLPAYVGVSPTARARVGQLPYTPVQPLSSDWKTVPHSPLLGGRSKIREGFVSFRPSQRSRALFLNRFCDPDVSRSAWEFNISLLRPYTPSVPEAAWWDALYYFLPWQGWGESASGPASSSPTLFRFELPVCI